MKLNIQSMHTPGLLIATNLVQLASSIAHARSLVTAAYSHAREIATAEANHEAADFCGDPYAHNCGRPHCRPSDSYTGPQPPLERSFFEVDAVAEAALPAAVPAELTNVRCMCGDEYPHDSYGAGFIAGSGMCEKCDAAQQPGPDSVPLYEAIEDACALLPYGWLIEVCAERDGASVTLHDSSGEKVNFPSNNERLDYTVNDAVEFALLSTKNAEEV
ncbi:hypothetical protein [Metapseudomonas otitidis]|uniref:hypothetical protein n=1 Tax=Metapseudomonas otitidis TaxID=319939 RepID=UPI00209B67BF|nr:hypothetical protein [Pseudomonas otitidis]MCO7557486.1 hypothetical protein [Pseudomonas otitidis]